MKKRIKQAAFALSLLGSVSTLCVKGMKAVDKIIRDRVAAEERNAYRKQEK